MANPNAQDVTVTFFFTDTNGVDSGHGSFVLGARRQLSAFLTEQPFNGAAQARGTFTFSASAAISVIALRGLRNERNEFLITTLGVTPVGVSGAGDVIPHFAHGGGWTTLVVLTNPTDVEQRGVVQFNGAGLSPASYTIRPRSSVRLDMSNAGAAIQTGWIRITPETGHGAPAAAAIFAFRQNGITVSEASIPAEPAGVSFHVYAESAGPIRSGIAITNASQTSTDAMLQLRRLDGTPVQQVSRTIPAGGQIAAFVHELFPGLADGYQGIVRISSTSPVSVTGLRGRYNERGDFLVTTTAPWNDASPAMDSELVFPHVVSGGGYTTQLILYGRPASGRVSFFSRDGVLEPF
jgi:hypothetical protein